jgi:hypothetical protein
MCLLIGRRHKVISIPSGSLLLRISVSFTFSKFELVSGSCFCLRLNSAATQVRRRRTVLTKVQRLALFTSQRSGCLPSYHWSRYLRHELRDLSAKIK